MFHLLPARPLFGKEPNFKSWDLDFGCVDYEEERVWLLSMVRAGVCYHVTSYGFGLDDRLRRER